jgi:ribosomal protein S12
VVMVRRGKVKDLPNVKYNIGGIKYLQGILG